MSRHVIVVGAGGFGRETLDVLEAVNSARAGSIQVLGVLDDGPSSVNLGRLAARGTSHLGSVDAWLKQGDREADYVIAVGQPAVRRALAARFDAAGRSAATVLHPSAVIGSVCRIGPGTVMCAGVQVSTNVTIGAHVQLNPGVTVGHDTVLGQFASVNPSATVSGDCLIGEGVLIGAGSVVLQGITVGAGAVVGAAACVVRDVAERAVVRGVPAR
ncbi:MAG: NeuD/PglB/VioB family sugar acetyltransferase [Nakamurella sp.]